MYSCIEEMTKGLATLSLSTTNSAGLAGFFPLPRFDRKIVANREDFPT
jgi:hypothetical protein